ncbi:AsnC family transcriptional regulator [Candidatus Woesearchaeota archaeon]|nr:AsnC family transcriptional regulator [Candidatus Woesearchaeota archaeon]
MSKIKLDKKDIRILAELDFNARATLSHLAKVVGLKKNSVAYRLKRLEKSGLIEGYYTIIDLARIGNYYLRVWIKYHNISNEEEKELIDYLIKSGKYGFIVSIGGKYDLCFSFNIKNLYEVEERMDILMKKFGHLFKELNHSFVSKIYFFENSFIYADNTKRKNIIKYIGRDPLKKAVDDIDLKIINILSGNGRISFADIAKKIKIHPKNVKYRLKRLQDNNIILGFRMKLNYFDFNYHYYKLFLHCKNLDKKKIKEMITYGNYHNNIIYFIKTLMDPQVEYEIITKSTKEIYEILKEIKFKFKDVIKDLTYEETYKEYKSIYYVH